VRTVLEALMKEAIRLKAEAKILKRQFLLKKKTQIYKLL
jgi:hypothetical protein